MTGRAGRVDAVHGALVAAYDGLRRFTAVVADRDLDPDDVLHEAMARVLLATRRGRGPTGDVVAYTRRAILSVCANARRSFARRTRALARLGTPTETIERRGERGVTGPSGGIAAETFVAHAARTATRRHRVQRLVTGAVTAGIALVLGVVGWQALGGRDQAVQVMSPDTTEPAPTPEPGDRDRLPGEERRAEQARKAAQARQAERARQEQRHRAVTEAEARHNARLVQSPAGRPLVEHHGIGLRVPEGWFTSGENLTPDVASPRPVAAAGTAPLDVGGGRRCAQVPIQAVLAMGSEDVFVALVEGASIGSPDRGGSLWAMRGEPNQVSWVDCPEWPTGFDAWWAPFHDNGRGFHLLVVTGPDATAERLAQLAAVVDLLVVHPR